MMNNKRIINKWLVITGLIVSFILVIFIVAIWELGFLESIEDKDNGTKIIVSAISLVGALIGALISFVGIFLKHSFDVRNFHLKEEAEKRFKLEAAIEAISLLGTDTGTEVNKSQKAGVLISLTNLNLDDLALSISETFINNDKVDICAISCMIDKIFMHNNTGSQVKAAELLHNHYKKFLLPKGKVSFPKCMFDGKWAVNLPLLARAETSKALLKILISRPFKKWNENTFNSILVTLITIWETDPERYIKTGVGNCLEKIIKLRAGWKLYMENKTIITNKIDFCKLDRVHIVSSFQLILKNTDIWFNQANSKKK